MEPQIAIDIGRDAVHMALTLSAPVLIVVAVVGVLVGFLQAVTQIQDQSILFAVRLAAAVVVISMCLPWLVEHYTGYSRELIEHIPTTITVQGPLWIHW